MGFCVLTYLLIKSVYLVWVNIGTFASKTISIELNNTEGSLSRLVNNGGSEVWLFLNLNIIIKADATAKINIIYIWLNNMNILILSTSFCSKTYSHNKQMNIYISIKIEIYKSIHLERLQIKRWELKTICTNTGGSTKHLN